MHSFTTMASEDKPLPIHILCNADEYDFKSAGLLVKGETVFVAEEMFNRFCTARRRASIQLLEQATAAAKRLDAVAQQLDGRNRVDMFRDPELFFEALVAEGLLAQTGRTQALVTQLSHAVEANAPRV